MFCNAHSWLDDKTESPSTLKIRQGSGWFFQYDFERVHYERCFRSHPFYGVTIGMRHASIRASPCPRSEARDQGSTSSTCDDTRSPPDPSSIPNLSVAALYMHRFVLGFFLTCLALSPSLPATAGSAEIPTLQLVDLDVVLTAAMEGTATPAIGALVIRDGRIEQLAVRGVRRSDQSGAVDAADTWLIGSTGKPMTVALIARLVDQGVLDWSAPLSEMLPELSGRMRPEYRAVTLVQLLSHRSGLPENLTDATLLDAFFTDTRPLSQQRMALVAAALKEAPAAAAGGEFTYSNTGFLVAALIAERKTGKTFEALMEQEVFEPLKMASVGFGPTPEGQPRGHRAGAPVLQAPAKSDDGVPMVYTAAGNLHMSLHDWAQFCLDQLAGSQGRGALLSPASYRLMQAAQPGSPSGMDWGVQDSIAGRQGPVLVHGGSDGNWLAWAVLFPKSGTGVLVVANGAADMGADQATHKVMGALFPGLSPAK